MALECICLYFLNTFPNSVPHLHDNKTQLTLTQANNSIKLVIYSTFAQWFSFIWPLKVLGVNMNNTKCKMTRQVWNNERKALTLRKV